MNPNGPHLQYKIIIGDIDTAGLNHMSAILRSAGYSVMATPSSNRIFRLIRKSVPDLLILSSKLKDLDGIEACRILVDKLNFTNPIMMVSDDTLEQTIMRAFDAGVSEFLPGPCPPPGLLCAKVKILLQQAESSVSETASEQDDNQKSGLMSELDLPAYRIIEKIGSGAMGDVYKAIHKFTFETVAIKVVDAAKAKSIRDIQRFFRGSLIGLELPRHPNLVQVIEIKKLKETIYQVMEYVEGQTLQAIIKNKEILSDAQAICVVKDLTLALDMLDQHQILHRDVKPGNIFITSDWLCKLGDLGISRRLIDRTATSTGHIVGTPGYISPEQILDIRPLDIRSDLYSLGLTLYHAVSGSNPFAKSTPYESMLARLEGPEVVLNDENSPQITTGLRNVINRMIRRRAIERYSTPLAVLSDLERLGLFTSQNRTIHNPVINQPEEFPDNN